MANNPTSFRYPSPPSWEAGHRLVMNALKDLNDAIVALNGKTATPATITQVVQGGGGGASPTGASIAYVDGAINALDVKASCHAATAAALPAYTYSGGVITASGNGALTVDGVAVVANDRVLVKDGAAGSDNGIYLVTQPGDAGTPFILTRTGDCNTSANYVPGAFTVIEEGTANKAFPFVVSTQGIITVGTTAVTWSKLAAGSGSSPLTTKGDLYGYTTTDARIPVGADGTVLTADSTQAAGVKWNTPSASGVTSVGLSMPAEFSVGGSPVTTSGTLAVTKATESANTVWAGPTSGGAAQPAFRALVAADIPDANRYRAVSFVAQDVSAIATGVIGVPVQVWYSGTIVGWWIEFGVGVSDSVQIAVSKKVSSAPPAAPSQPNTTTDKISASAPIAVSSAVSASGGTSEVSTWTTSVAQYDTIIFNITNAPATAKSLAGALIIKI